MSKALPAAELAKTLWEKIKKRWRHFLSEDMIAYWWLLLIINTACHFRLLLHYTSKCAHFSLLFVFTIRQSIISYTRYFRVRRSHAQYATCFVLNKIVSLCHDFTLMTLNFWVWRFYTYFMNRDGALIRRLFLAHDSFHARRHCHIDY